MDNWGGGGGGGIRQLINILFCGYRRSENHAETYTRLGHRVPQRVIRLHTKVQRVKVTYACQLDKVEDIVPFKF